MDIPVDARTFLPPLSLSFAGGDFWISGQVDIHFPFSFYVAAPTIGTQPPVRVRRSYPVFLVFPA